MSEITRIVDQLEREHDGDPWHGSPLSAILDGVYQLLHGLVQHDTYHAGQIALLKKR